MGLSGSGFADFNESGSNLDPASDPKHCLQTRLNSNPIGSPEECVLFCMKLSLARRGFSFLLFEI